MKIKYILTLMMLLAYLLNPAQALGEFVTFDPLGDKLRDQGIAPNFMDEIFNSLGVDKAELQYGVQSMNVARQKKTPPSVSLTFNPSNPAPSEKVTAIALPLYFLNDTKNMYFTWFLKSANCDKTNFPSGEEEKKCDLNGDNKVDIEDYKIKAARIIASSSFQWETESYRSDSDSDGYSAKQGGDDQAGKKDYCFIHDVESGDEFQLGCGHLFPNAPGATTGDGSFDLAEERFWHTDPNANDTAGTGNGDEANIAGLGVNSFSWNYESGDEVGVVVEGVSTEPTQTDNASYRTMWAATKNLCGKLSVSRDYPKTTTKIISETTGVDSSDPLNPINTLTTVTETTTESIDSSAATIAQIEKTVVTTTTVKNADTGAQISQTSTSQSSHAVQDISNDIKISGIEDAKDLNACLYNSLVTPAEGGGSADRLEASLSYFPENPVNDPTDGNNGDELNILASLVNAKDPKFVHYSWQVYESDEINPDSWGTPLLKSSLRDSSQSVGLDLSTFKFRLNFENPKKYLRVKLDVSENIGKTERKGYSDIVIPLYSNSQSIKAYRTEISDDIKLSLSDEICAGEDETGICPVAKDDIIGLKFPGSGYSDFLWTIDGEPFSYDTCYFQGCDENSVGNVAYFPIKKNKGERVTVNLSAVNKKNGDKVDLSKIFEVTEPQIKISSLDEKKCGPVLLGNYIDTDGKAWPDYSDQNFWGIAGQEIKLKAETVGFSAKPDEYTWYVNNEPVTGESDGSLTLPAKATGEKYNVAVSSIYAPDNLARKALSQYWNISYGQFYERPVADSIDIIMAESGEATAAKNNTRILAALYTSLPAYFAFLLRIVLTAFIIIAASMWLVSWFPNLKDEKE